MREPRTRTSQLYEIRAQLEGMITRVETGGLGNLVGDGRALLRRHTCRGTKHSDQQDTDNGDAARFRHGVPSWAARNPYMPSITAVSNRKEQEIACLRGWSEYAPYWDRYDS